MNRLKTNSMFTFFTHHRYAFLLILAFLIYTVVWSYIDLFRLDTLNALWADLGLSMERGWLIYNNNWNLLGYLYIFFNSGILFLTFPITFPQSFQLMLVVQTIIIASAAFPLYGIAIHFIENKKYSFLITVMYFIYFPLSGLNWYDFHYQSFFPLFFLLAFYLFLKEHYLFSLLFFFFSSIVRYPYAAFTFLFSVSIIFRSIYYKKHQSSVSNGLSFPFALLLLSTFLLLGAYVINGGFSYVSSTVGYSGANLTSNSLSLGIETFLYIFLPLGFIPLLSRKWFITYLPYMILVVYIGGYGKVIPTAFHYQYTAMITPFVFLGLIDVFVKVKNLKIRVIHNTKWLRNLFMHRSKIILITIVLLSIFSATLFEPYGPVNKYNFDNFENFANYSSGNPASLGYLHKVINYIPKDNSSVLTQFNLPEIYPRPQILKTFPNEILTLIAGHSAMGDMINLTLKNVRNDTYSAIVYSNHTNMVIHFHIYYALAYTPSPWYTNDYPYSMQNFIQLMNQSGKYGIIANYEGFILMEWGYKGPIELNGND